jgi:uncharacterized Tic20 family protein
LVRAQSARIRRAALDDAPAWGGAISDRVRFGPRSPAEPRAEWWALELVPHGGLAPLTIYGHFVPRERAALQSYAAWLASMLRLRLDVDPALSTLDATGVDERTAAMLCYLPVQGIFIGASLYYLLRGDTRPLVRFSARQSLCQLLLSSLLLLLIIALFGVPLALVPNGPVRIALLVLLTLSLVGFVIWNIWAHILACSRAYRRIAWVMPWLGPRCGAGCRRASLACSALDRCRRRTQDELIKSEV